MGLLTLRRCECGREFATDTNLTKCPECRKRGSYRAAKARQTLYRFAGYHAARDIPSDDYEDFRYMTLSNLEVQTMAGAGYLPPGLMLKAGGKKYLVTGDYGRKNQLEAA